MTRGTHGRQREPVSTPVEQSQDPAASMSLLNQLLMNPLDAGYEAWVDPPESRQVRWGYRLLVLLLALALGVGLTFAVRALRVPESASLRSELLERARERQMVVTELEAEVADLSTQVNAHVEAQGTGSSATDTPLALSTATSTVTGPGLFVTLKDSQDADAASRPGGGAVRDQDLRMVVNALWAAGAEAISVNDNRIAPGTFIRTAGSVILVNVTATEAPYEIRAIGDANALSTALVRGSTGDYLSSAESVIGISVSASAQSSVTMVGTDLQVLRYARIIDSSGGQ